MCQRMSIVSQMQFCQTSIGFNQFGYFDVSQMVVREGEVSQLVFGQSAPNSIPFPRIQSLNRYERQTLNSRQLADKPFECRSSDSTVADIEVLNVRTSDQNRTQVFIPYDRFVDPIVTFLYGKT